MRSAIGLCLIPTLVVLPLAVRPPAENVAVGIFSDLAPGGIPDGWEPLRFPSISQETDYALREKDGHVVLAATSRRSASALVREIAVDLDRHPFLNWSWKTDDACFSGSWEQPDADDFPLRLFVMFEEAGGFLSLFRRLRPGFPGDALLYLTDRPPREERDHASHLSDRIQVVPLELPPDGLGWDRLVRNVRADYVARFRKVPGGVRAVAVMTDTDNSASHCVSYYGDIYFSEAGR